MVGTAGRRSGWNAQNSRSSSVKYGPFPSASGSARTVSAPAATQRRNVSTCAADSFFSPFGISPFATCAISKLCSGCPGTMAAPDSPPFTKKRRNRTSNPPLSFSPSP